jgi:hypothetical protein
MAARDDPLVAILAAGSPIWLDLWYDVAFEVINDG